MYFDVVFYGNKVDTWYLQIIILDKHFKKV